MLSSVEIGFSVLLFVILLAISVIDIRTLTIPDELNAVLAAAGIAQILLLNGACLITHIVGASLFGGVLLLARQLHATRTGTIGLGLGDVKMAVSAGFWVTPFHLPHVLALATGTGLLALLGARLLGPTIEISTVKLPLGPFLALGLMSVWLLERTQAMESFL